VEKPDTPAGGSNIVPRATMAGKAVNVQVTEYFPGYQCSINNMDWSPAVMFDAIFPISIRRGRIPWLAFKPSSSSPAEPYRARFP